MSEPLFKKKQVWLILAFLVGCGYMLVHCEDANADWAVDYWHDSNAGSSDENGGYDRLCVRKFLNEKNSFGVCPLLAEAGDIDEGLALDFTEKLGRWEANLHIDYFREEMYGGVGVRRLIGDGPFQMGIGASYWVNESPGSDSQLTFNLGMRYTF